MYSSIFLKWFLESNELEHQLEKYLVGTAIRTIPVIKIREIRIPEVKMEKQLEISQVVQFWNKQKVLLNHMINEKEKYYNSIIKKVINGGKK